MAFLPRPPKEDLPRLVTESGHPIPVYDLLDVNLDHVSSYLAEQADWQALISHQHGLAKLRVERLSSDLEEAKAAAFISIYNNLKSSKVTVDFIKASVIVDPRVQTIRLKLEDAKKTESAFDAMRWAMQTRRDIIIQLGADIRLERKLLPR